jgi:hypothetical protein
MSVRFCAVIAFTVFPILAIAACPADTRRVQLPIDDESLEQNDVVNGRIATAAICGGCFFANAPGVAADQAHPLTITVNWGDGHTDAVRIPSNDQNPAALALGPNGIITGRHTYSSLVNPRTNRLVTLSAFCVNTGQPTWLEAVDNQCNGQTKPCEPHPATIGVYAAVASTLTAITKRVQHGIVNQETLSVVLRTSAPPSGTKVMLVSNNGTVLFPQPNGPSKRQTTVTIPAGQSAANVDIDAKGAAAGARFTITARSPANLQAVDTGQQIVQ